MTEEENIREMMAKYILAIDSNDFKSLPQYATEKCCVQFNPFLKLAILTMNKIVPKKFGARKMSDLTIESLEESKAIIHYALDIGRRHTYERVVLLKIDGSWKVDAKFL